MGLQHIFVKEFSETTSELSSNSLIISGAQNTFRKY